MTEFPTITPSEVPAHIYERRAWITAKLTLRKSSQSKLAAKLGCSRQTLNQCLISPKSARIDKGVADVLGLALHELFPERYHANGEAVFRTVTEASSAA